MHLPLLKRLFTLTPSGIYFPSRQDGFVLVITLLMLVVLTIIGLSATSTTEIELQIAGNDRIHKESFYHADGGEEIGIQAVEENVSCPTGFTKSTLTAAQRNDPMVFFTIQGMQFADDRFGLDETIADLPWDPVVNGGTAGATITLDDVPSNGARTIRIPQDITNPNDTDPHTNIAIYGTTHLSAGSAIQMAAGYDGKGKGTAGSGAYIAYNIHSQHLGQRQSDTRLLVEWRHLVGQEGECFY